MFGHGALGQFAFGEYRKELKFASVIETDAADADGNVEVVVSALADIEAGPSSIDGLVDPLVEASGDLEVALPILIIGLDIIVSTSGTWEASNATLSGSMDPIVGASADISVESSVDGAVGIGWGFIGGLFTEAASMSTSVSIVVVARGAIEPSLPDFSFDFELEGFIGVSGTILSGPAFIDLRYFILDDIEDGVKPWIGRGVIRPMEGEYYELVWVSKGEILPYEGEAYIEVSDGKSVILVIESKTLN